MWYWAFRAAFRGILKLFFKFNVEGLENLPQKTNFIVVANHNSYLDPVVLGAALPCRVYWITTYVLFKFSWLRWFFKKVGALPTGNASDRTLCLLEKNKNIGIFPEGAISRDGQLKEFHRGAAVLALKTGRPIVPCAILGTFTALPFGSFFPKFGPIKVKVGKPKFFLKEFTDIVDDLYLDGGIFEIRNKVKEMIYAG